MSVDQEGEVGEEVHWAQMLKTLDWHGMQGVLELVSVEKWEQVVEGDLLLEG